MTSYRPINSLTQMPTYGDFGAGARLREQELAQQERAQGAAARTAQIKAQTDYLKERDASAQRQLEIGKGMREREALTINRALIPGVERLSKVAENQAKMRQALDTQGGGPMQDFYGAEYQRWRAGISRGVEAGYLDPVMAQLPEQPPDPSALPEMMESLQQRLEVTSNPQAWNDEQTGAANLLAEMKQDPRLQDPNVAMRDPGWGQAKAQYMAQEMAARKAGAASTTVQVDTGKQPLERSVRSQTQGSLLENQQMLGHLAAIQAGAKPEMFTLWGKVKDKAGRVGAQLDPDIFGAQGLVDSVKARTKVNNDVEQLFNAYRKEITGAAAPIAELEQLRKVMLNMDLSWPEFQAAMEQFNDKLTRTIRLQRKVLREGVDLSPEEAAARINDLYTSGADARDAVDAKSRAAELRQSGMNDREVAMALATEGYLTPEQTQRLMERMQ